METRSKVAEYRAQKSRRPTAPPRRKACAACIAAKTRCDLRKPRCGRCLSRNQECQFIGCSDNAQSDEFVPAMPYLSPASSISTPPTGADRNDLLLAAGGANHQGTSLQRTTRTHIAVSPDILEQSTLSEPDFSTINLLPLVDFNRVRDRWLDVYIPSPLTNAVKDFQPRTIHFISRVLKSYPRMLMRSCTLPPFIHRKQLHGDGPPLLANCCSLVRMWFNRAAGSEKLISDTIENEMSRLMSEHASYDEVHLLAALQAYVLYGITSYFSDVPSSNRGQNAEGLHGVFASFSMPAVQQIAAQVTQGGLVCPEEITYTRPRWESWIVAEAKRRTLYTIYVFENVFNWNNGDRSYIAEELAFLPAPCGKRMWEAQDRETWEKEYDDHLQKWKGEPSLCMQEFWPKPEGEEARSARVDRWSEDVDEYGMMLLACCTLTHGS